MSRNAFAPGGKEYEKRKQNQKRRGARREAPEDAGDWRKKKKDEEEDEDDSESGSQSGSGSEDESSGEDLFQRGGDDKAAAGTGTGAGAGVGAGVGVAEKAKVEPLIEVENPNRQKKAHVKASAIDPSAKPELSRREREELDKQRAKEKYLELHRQGKTDEAKADLARLAVIRKQREDAARKKAEELKAKEDAKLAARKR